MVFQSMQRGSTRSPPLAEQLSFLGIRTFRDRRISQNSISSSGSYADDPTNWWIPNSACSEAMLRSAGFEIVASSGEGGLRLPKDRQPGGGGGGLPDAREKRHDRSRDDLERAQQQVALGSRARSRLGAFREMAIMAARSDRSRQPGAHQGARRHLADRPEVHRSACATGVCSTISTRWPCTVFRSTGTFGRSRNGPQSSTRSARSLICRSG